LNAEQRFEIGLMVAYRTRVRASNSLRPAICPLILHREQKTGDVAMLKVGIAGFGNIGRTVSRALLAGKISGVELVAVAARDLEKARVTAKELSPTLKVVPLTELAALCDIVVESATGPSFPEIARTILPSGKPMICISAGGFLAIPELADLAKKHGAQIQIASGTMPGLDILRSAAEGTIRKVHLKSRIFPKSLANEPYVLEQGFDFREQPPQGPVKVFEGTAREAAKHFPRHLNVAVSISLAGVGLDKTTLELWLDPDIKGAINLLEIESDEVGLTMTSRNVPSENPKTSRIVALSMLAALRARVATIRVGS
jgi:aspartate dehydrogenase